MIKLLSIHGHEAYYKIKKGQLMVGEVPASGKPIDWGEASANLGIWHRDEKIDRQMADDFLRVINNHFKTALQHRDFPGR